MSWEWPIHTVCMPVEDLRTAIISWPSGRLLSSMTSIGTPISLKTLLAIRQYEHVVVEKITTQWSLTVCCTKVACEEPIPIYTIHSATTRSFTSVTAKSICHVDKASVSAWSSFLTVLALSRGPQSVGLDFVSRNCVHIDAWFIQCVLAIYTVHISVQCSTKSFFSLRLGHISKQGLTSILLILEHKVYKL